MAKITLIDREVGDSPYKWREFGYEIDITDHPLRDLIVRDAEREHQKRLNALNARLFADGE